MFVTKEKHYGESGFDENCTAVTPVKETVYDEIEADEDSSYKIGAKVEALANMAEGWKPGVVEALLDGGMFKIKLGDGSTATVMEFQVRSPEGNAEEQKKEALQPGDWVRVRYGGDFKKTHPDARRVFEGTIVSLDGKGATVDFGSRGGGKVTYDKQGANYADDNDFVVYIKKLDDGRLQAAELRTQILDFAAELTSNAVDMGMSVEQMLAFVNEEAETRLESAVEALQAGDVEEAVVTDFRATVVKVVAQMLERWAGKEPEKKEEDEEEKKKDPVECFVDPPYKCPLCGRFRDTVDDMLCHLRIHERTNRQGKCMEALLEKEPDKALDIIDKEMKNVVGDNTVKNAIEVTKRNSNFSKDNSYWRYQCYKYMGFKEVPKDPAVVHPVRAAWPEAHGQYTNLMGSDRLDEADRDRRGIIRPGANQHGDRWRQDRGGRDRGRDDRRDRKRRSDLWR